MALPSEKPKANLVQLADELLIRILDFVEGEFSEMNDVDKRGYLDQESFKPPSPPKPARQEDIKNFRLVCRKCANVGATYQFSRVTMSFSKRGLQRLETIADQPHLAPLIKKLTYMVPFFFIEGPAYFPLNPF